MASHLLSILHMEDCKNGTSPALGMAWGAYEPKKQKCYNEWPLSTFYKAYTCAVRAYICGEEDTC